MTEILIRHLREDLKCFYELAERFSKKELQERALELDHYPYSEFNFRALSSAKELELFKLTLPESFSGSAQGMAALSIVLSRLAQADASFSAVLFIQSIAQSAMVNYAKKEVAEKYLKTDTSSQPLIAFPVYAPITDIPLDVKAEKKDDGYLLSGNFPYLALAPVADVLIIPAEIPGEHRASFFIVERESPGLKVGEPVLSLGLRNCPVADVELNGVRVGRESILGEEEGLWKYYPKFCASFGGPLLALSLGVLVGSYQTAVSFARERYQGGKQIIEHNQVQMMLANMAILIEVAFAVCMSASTAVDEGGDPLPGFAGCSFLIDAITRATTDGVQCLGGYGYMHDYGQEKRMRDAKQIQAIFGPSPLKRLEFFQSQLKGT